MNLCPSFQDLKTRNTSNCFYNQETLLERSRSYQRQYKSRLHNFKDDIEIRDITLDDGRAGREISVRFIPQIEDLKLRPKYPEEQREKAIVVLARERESLNTLAYKFHLLIFGIGAIAVFFITISVTQSVRSGLRAADLVLPVISVKITPDSMDIRISTDNQPIELESIAKPV